MQTTTTTTIDEQVQPSTGTAPGSAADGGPCHERDRARAQRAAAGVEASYLLSVSPR